MIESIKSLGVGAAANAGELEMTPVKPTANAAQAGSSDFADLLGGLFASTATAVKTAEATSIAGIKGKATVQQVVTQGAFETAVLGGKVWIDNMEQWDLDNGQTAIDPIPMTFTRSGDTNRTGSLQGQNIIRTSEELGRKSHDGGVTYWLGGDSDASPFTITFTGGTTAFGFWASDIGDFTADDGIQHTIWIVNDGDTIERISSLFKTKVPSTYIADGHHRAASAAKVRKALGDAAQDGADLFLTTLFPSNQLHIMDYNRVVSDLNGLNEEAFLAAIKNKFAFEKAGKAFSPASLHEFGMYINKQWYRLSAREGSYSNDPIGVLDVTILQNNLLDPVLNIKDQRTDKRIDFVGGIRGLAELEKRVDSGEMAVAFSLHPVSIQQLFDIADSGNVMPPKSTWFEPKLRDGLLTHLIDNADKAGE